MQDSNTITLTLDPIVDSDFPHVSSRMQKLVNEFQSQNPVPAHQTPQVPAKKAIFSKNTKRFEDLSDDEQKLVLDRISSVDYMKSTDILEFGSNKSSSMTILTDEILSVQTRNPIESLSDPIFSVLSAIRRQNPKDILGTVTISTSQTEWGVFSSIREMLSMQKAQKCMAQAIYNLNTLMKNIKGMQVDLKKQQMCLQKDIALYEKLVQKATELFNEYELDCIALRKMKDYAQNTLNELKSTSQPSMSEKITINKLEDVINMIGRKIDTTLTMRVTTFQSIMQLDMLISSNKLLCAKIDEINELVIPLWKWQYVTTVGAIKQQDAVSLQKAIRGITSKVLTGNAQYLNDTMISAQKEVSNTATAVEDLGMVQTYIDLTLTKVSEGVCPVLKAPVSK